MKRDTLRKVVILSIAFLIGLIALGQILHDRSEALGLCSASCKCTRCGWAAIPTKPCMDWVTYCSGPGVVRNCSSYCANDR